MLALAHDDTAGGLPQRYPNKAERNAAKKARQIEEAASKNAQTEADERAGRWAKFIQQREQRSDETRAERREHEDPLDPLDTARNVDGHFWLWPMHTTHELDGQGFPNISEAFAGWLDKRGKAPLELVKRPVDAIMERLENRASAGDRMALCTVRWAAGMTVPDIMAELDLARSTVYGHIAAGKAWILEQLDKQDKEQQEEGSEKGSKSGG